MRLPCQIHRCVAALGFATLGIVAACSYAYDFEYRVTVSEDVDLDAFGPGTQVVMVMGSQDDVALATSYSRAATLDPARMEYRDGAQTCCAPPEPSFFFAFIDGDGDGTWTEGEPWGEDPKNPVVLDEDDYVARIEIGPAVAPD